MFNWLVHALLKYINLPTLSVKVRIYYYFKNLQ